MLRSCLPRTVRLVIVSIGTASLVAVSGTAGADSGDGAAPPATLSDVVQGPETVMDDEAPQGAPLEGTPVAPLADSPTSTLAGGTAVLGPPVSRYQFSTPPEPPARYVGQVSCEAGPQPGTSALRNLLIDTYGQASIGTLRGCSTGGRSEHKDGRALDWMLDVRDGADKATADAFLAWLIGRDAQGVSAGNARRLGVMYVIWNRQTWQAWNGAWKPYEGSSPHTDHIHISLSWNGAMKRTSWWTGVVADKDDYGPCQTYVGEPAPRYSGPRYSPCPPPVYRTGLAFPRLWDGDVAADVVATTSSGALLLYRGSGVGSFRGGSQIGHGWTYMDGVTATGDFDGDGRRDIIARNPSGRLYLYRGNGSGGFLGTAQIGHGWGGMDTIVGAGDLDNDGAVDLLARRASDGRVFTYFGSATGGFAGSREVARMSGADLIIAAGDWDGDSRPDVMTRDASGRLYLRSGDGRGGFEGPEQVGHGWGGMDAVIGTGDFSGDGRADLLARHSNGRLWMYRGNGLGGFSGAVQVGHGWGELSLVR